MLKMSDCRRCKYGHVAVRSDVKPKIEHASIYSPLNFVRDYPSEPVPEPTWIFLEQETVSGSGISWAICESAPRLRQITTPASHHSVFTGRMPFLPPNRQRQSSEGKTGD